MTTFLITLSLCSDDHQRVVLVAQVEVAHGQQSSLVTVATSHFR